MIVLNNTELMFFWRDIRHADGRISFHKKCPGDKLVCSADGNDDSKKYIHILVAGHLLALFIADPILLWWS